MFKFNFELGDVDDMDSTVFESPAPQEEHNVSQRAHKAAAHKMFIEHALVDLAAQLPPDISYSPLTIAHPGSTSPVTIARRDLFDARYQLIASESSDGPADTAFTGQDDLDFIEAPSDLTPGIYEGGLKTWECSIDLAAMLQELLPSPSEWRCRRILELGCGTAVPSLYLLKTLFEADADPNRHISVHVQDYNELVFRLVTLPNIILAWYMSPASVSFRSQAASRATGQTEGEDTEGDHAEADREIFPLPSPSEPGELPFTPGLLSAFTRSLIDYGIELRFFSGSWDTFDIHTAGGRYDVVLTSETIYRIDSLPSLLDLMWTACMGGDSNTDRPLEELAQDNLNLENNDQDHRYICVVAAKLVYFGVGGGVREFIQAVESGMPSNISRSKGSVETLWNSEDGVKRSVTKVHWQ